MIPADVQETLDLAGLEVVFVPDLSWEGWLLEPAVCANGRRVILVDALLTPDRLAEVADWTLADVAQDACARHG